MKLRSFVLLLLTSLLSSRSILADRHSCTYSAVEWKDAALYSRPTDPDFDHPESFLVTQRSIGCAEVSEKVVVVFFNFSAGNPDNFIAIPAAWVVKVTTLTEDHPPPAKPETKKTSLWTKFFR